MYQHCQRCDYAQPQISHEGRSYQNTIAKSMHAVPGQNGPGTTFGFGMMMPMVVTMIVSTASIVLMPVVP